MPDETIMTHTVFGALTRPAMSHGVTFEYHMLNTMLSVIIFILLGNVLYGLVFIPLHVFGWLVCRYDTHFFTLMNKYCLLLPSVPNQAIWGVRTYEPF